MVRTFTYRNSHYINFLFAVALLWAGGASAKNGIKMLNKTPFFSTTILSFSPAAVTKTFGNADFVPIIFTNSPAAVTFSIDPIYASVATVVNNKIHIVGGGTNITVIANQAASGTFTAASDTRTIRIDKALPKITFNNTAKLYTAADFSPATVAITGSISATNTAKAMLTYTADLVINNAATVFANKIHLISIGTASITVIIPETDQYLSIATAYSIPVNPGLLKITASNKTRSYGSTAANLVPTFNYTGLRSGETATIALLNLPTAIVDNYDPITPAGTILNISINNSPTAQNYTVTQVNGLLTIIKATLTVTANATKIYGAVVPAITITYNKFLNSDSPADVFTDPNNQPIATATSFIDINTPVGSYPINVSGPTLSSTNPQIDNPNYVVKYIAGKFSVKPATIKVATSNKSKVYQDSNPIFTSLDNTITGYVNNDTEASSIITYPNIPSTIATLTSIPGNYPITSGGAVANNNYKVNYANGRLNITKPILTITPQNTTRKYGEPNPINLPPNITGFVGSDNQSDPSFVQPTIITSADVASNASTNPLRYSIVASGASMPNYTIKYMPGYLTISKAIITVTAKDTVSLYGNIPVYAFTYSGFKNGQGPSVFTRKPIGLTSPAISKTTTVGSYSFLPDAAATSANYNFIFSSNPATITIAKTNLNIYVNQTTLVYGDNPLLTLKYIGFKNNENSGVLIPRPIAFTNANGASLPNEVDSVHISNTTSPNYNIVKHDTVLTVLKRPLITYVNPANPAAVVYGNPLPAFTASYKSTVASNASGTGFVNNEATKVIRATVNVPVKPAIGHYKITINPVADLSPNTVLTKYDTSHVDGQLTIVKRPIIITILDPNKIYGTALVTNTISVNSGFTVIGLAPNEVITSLTITPDAAGIDVTTPAGSSYTVAASNLVGSGGFIDSNYVVIYVPTSFTVGKATLIATARDTTKFYGESNPQFKIDYSGFLNGDTKENSITTFPSANSIASNTTAIGNYPIVLSGGLSNNYVFSYIPGNLSINKAIIIINAESKSKAYGASDPPLTYTYTGTLASGDNLSGNVQRAAGEILGDYVINQGNLTVTNASNYNLIYNAANFTITPNNILITVDALSKNYHQADPPLTYTYSGTLAAGDSFTGTLERAPGENAGVYPISHGNLEINNNYNITYTPNAIFTIKKNIITVVAVPVSKIYGDIDPILYNYISIGTIVTGDGFTGFLSRVGGEAIGSYQINQNTLFLGDNYTIDYVGANFTISKKTITVTATAQTKIYGDADPALTYTYTPLANGDHFIGTLKRIPGENIGTTYTIAQNTLAINGNYTLLYNAAPFSITKRAILITAESKLKSYGAIDPLLTFTITGSLANADAFSGSLLRAAGESIGSYAIGLGSLSVSNLNNYDLAYSGAFFNIGKSNIAITAANQTKVYGTADPSLTYTYTGSLANGDHITGDLQRNTGESIGNYTITQGDLAITNSNNYIVDYSGANLNITPKNILVTPNNLSKNYGQPDPPLTYSYSGTLAAGDGFSGSLERMTGENAGSYTIGQGTLALNGNYTLTYSANNNFLINKNIITVVANPAGKTYGDLDPALTFQITSGTLIGGDSFTGLLSRVTGQDVGTYQIHQNSLTLGNNYILNYTGADFIVSKKTITVTADGKSKVYGDPDPILTFVNTSLANGDNFSGTLKREIGEPAGMYVINQSSLALGSNYVLNYGGAVFSITKATLNAKADDKHKALGDQIPALTITYTGFAFNQAAADLTVPPNISTTADANSAIGTYPIAVTGGQSNNYLITYNSGLLFVDKKTQSIRFDPLPDQPLSNPDFSPGALASSGQTVNYISSNTDVATITPAGLIHIVGEGNSTITAMQAGDADYLPASPVSQLLTVTNTTKPKQTQIITFDPLPTQIFGDPDFLPGASASSGQTISYSSSDTRVATVSSSGLIHIAGAGTSTIIASQAGDANYLAALDVTQLLIVGKANQVITFNPLPVSSFDDADFDPGASSSNITIPITYNSSNTAVATILNEMIHIVGIGSSTITASQPGNVDFNAAIDAVQVITVNKTAQVITFNALTNKVLGIADFDPGAIASSNLIIGYSSSNVDVATIVNGQIHITGLGATIITATQPGNTAYLAATPIAQPLIVSETSQTITFAALPIKSYGDADFDLTAIASSGLPVSYTSSNDAVATVSGSTIHIVGMGVVTITASQIGTDVYGSAQSIDNVLTISPALITISATAQAKVYGNADQALTFTYTGTIIIGDIFTGAISRASGETAGIYAIGLGSLTLGNNYDITYIGADLTITKQPLTITANDQTRPYNTANQAFTLRYTGFVNADSELNLTALPIVASIATTITPPGDYPIIASGATSQNYTFNYISGNLNISPITREITFNGLPVKTYGDADFDGGATASLGSDLPTYTSSNLLVATIVNGKVHITGAGITTITATLPANNIFTNNPFALQTLVVNKAYQSITFADFLTVLRGSLFDLSIIKSTSGLPVTFATNDKSIASVSGQTLNALRLGSTGIIASQAGNENYFAADQVVRSVKVTDSNGDEIIVHQALSPNGDGNNDFLYIEGINAYPGNRVSVINRNGVRIFDINGYDNAGKVFDGHSNVNSQGANTGAFQQPGTYFYLVEYVTATGEGRHKTGWFVLKY